MIHAPGTFRSARSCSLATESSRSRAHRRSGLLGFGGRAAAGDRDTVGSSEQSLNAVSSNLQSTEQNLTSALSTIQDANVAQTYATFTQQSVLQQAGVQVLRQAEQTPSQLVALFQ